MDSWFLSSLLSALQRYVIIFIPLFIIFAIKLLKTVLAIRKEVLSVNRLPQLRMSVLARHIFFPLILFRNRGSNSIQSQFLQLIAGMAKVYEKHKIVNGWVFSRHLFIALKPAIAEIILSSNTIIDKAKEYKFFDSWVGKGLATSPGAEWRARRKLLTPSFHFRVLDDFIPIFNNSSRILVKKLMSLEDKSCVEIQPILGSFVLSLICETAMGVSVDGRNDKKIEYLQAIDGIGDLFLKRVFTPYLWWNPIYKLSAVGREFNRRLNIMKKFTREVIKDRKEQSVRRKSMVEYINEKPSDGIIRQKRRPFIDILIKLHIQDPSFTEQDIEDEVNTFMFAGHDTGTNSIMWTLYNIGLYPDIQEKLLKEIDGVFGNDNERSVTPEDIKSLNYFDQVFKETLRLYPPVPLIAREIYQDVEIAGYTVCAGTMCVIPAYVIHRDPETFPNPEIFDPDRFLQENCSRRHPYAFIPFSAGPRNCIGQRFGQIDAKVALSHILRKFKVKSLDPPDKVVLSWNILLCPVKPIRIQFIPRQAAK